MLPTIITLNGWVETQKERTKQVLNASCCVSHLKLPVGGPMDLWNSQGEKKGNVIVLTLTW